MKLVAWSEYANETKRENKHAANGRINRPKAPTNTFCVPDDDDDDDDDDHVEISGQPDPMLSTVEIGSDSEDESEDGSVVEVCSPTTAPSKDFDEGVRGGSQKTPIEIDGEQKSQPLATPRMTPSSNEGVPAEGDIETREQLADSGDSEIDSLLDYSADELASQSGDDESVSDEDSMSDSSFESDIELSDADGISAAAMAMPAVSASRKPDQANTSSLCGKKANVSPHSSDQAVHVPGKQADGELLPENPSDGNIELPGIRSDILNPNPQSLLEPEVVLAETPCKPISSAWSSTQQLYANAYPPLQPRGRIFDHSLTGFHLNSYARDFEDWTSRGNAIPQYVQPRIGRIAHHHDLALNDASRPGTCYHDGPFAQPSLIMPATSAVTGPTSGVDTNNPAPPTFGNESIPANPGSRPDTRLRIADIVSSPQPPAQKAPRKRKVADMENGPLAFPHSLLHNSSAFDYNASSNSNEDPHDGAASDDGARSDETCLSGAQPRHEDIGALIDRCTQLTAVSEANEANSTGDIPRSEPETERPSKRLKKSEASNIGSHAATAVVSAVIGAVGTVAVLASLPPDYFV